jgi:putative flippase GtrA
MLKKYFDNTPKFIKFLITGGINAVFAYAVFSLLVFMGFHYIWVVILGNILGVLFNFNTIGRLVFSSFDKSKIFRFIGVYVIISIVSIILLRIFEILKINIYLSGIILLFPIAALSFTLHKNFVFKS